MLMILLFQRLGIIMILAFLLVNNSYFRQLIEERSKREKLVLIIIFGIFVIISNMTGIEITSDKSLVERPILTTISHSDSLANTRTLVITTASLVGGPLVGTVVGFIGGVHRFFQGNFSGAFYIVSSALVGYISGRLGDQLKTNNLYPSTSQVIVISIIAESIQMLFVGFFTGWDLVKLIFIPMMLLNSLGSTLFLAILKTYLSNERQLRAVQTRDVLDLTQQTLPYLRQGLSQQSATKVCNIIKQHTNFDAVGLTDRTNVLAHIGVGQDHHIAGQAVKTDLSKSVILNGQPQIALDKTAIACPDQSCLLNSAIVVPLKINNETVGALKMYFSGDKKMTEVEEKKQERTEKLLMTLTMVVSFALAIGIFMVLPYFLSDLLKKWISSYTVRIIIEGIIRIAIFVAYVGGISVMNDIKRLYRYHGAEHKCINCIEHGLPLTVENVRKSSKEHKRCGTSFMLFVMIVGIVLLFFVRVESPLMRVIVRIALLPVIAGISYELIKWAGSSENPVVCILSKPGLWLQGLTTKEPDDEMIEVGIAAVEAVFDWKAYLRENFGYKEEE